MAMIIPLLTAALFARTIDAVSAEEAEIDNINVNHNYGYAMYGFWGGIVLLGVIHKLWHQFHSARVAPKPTDSERQTSAAGRPKFHLVDTMGHWIETNLITPPAFGTHHSRLLYWCTIPTRLEMIVVVAYWILSIVLAGAGYVYYPSKGSTSSITSQRWEGFADRCALLALSNLPIIWLFAGRNNIFLWLTGWSFQTFSIFHRHIARVTILFVIGHASAYTHKALTTHLPTGVTLYRYGLTQSWFVWGIASATAFGAFWLTSVSWLRRKYYELFLLTHIGLGVVVIYGIFRHTSHEGAAFNNYLWPLVAIWSFDRLLRLTRIIVCNFHVKYSSSPLHIATTRATYDKKSDIIHVQIETSGLGLFNPSPGQYCFLYQPSSLKFWESHPFTIGAWSPAAPSILTSGGSTPPSPIEKELRIDSIAPTTSQSLSRGTSRTVNDPWPTTNTKTLSFWIRPYDGWTRRLRSQCTKSPSGVAHPRLLMEGPYGHTKHIHRFDSVVFIVGGTGISAAAPYIKDHMSRMNENTSRVSEMRLVWSTRQADFVKKVCDQGLSTMLWRPDFRMDVFLTDGMSANHDMLGGAKEDVRDSASLQRVTYHHGRPDLANVVGAAASDLRLGDKCAVFVCGPATMADDARLATHAAMKAGCRGLEYFEDNFGW